MSSNSGNSLSKFEIGSGNWTLILVGGSCSLVAKSDRIFILGPTNFFHIPELQCRYGIPGTFLFHWRLLILYRAGRGCMQMLLM